jgi:hypothetical protein
MAVDTIVASMEIMNMDIITDAMTSDRADLGS